MHCTEKQEVDWKTTPHHMLNLGSGDTKTPDVRYDSHMVLCISVRRKCISGYHGAWRCIAGEGEDAYCNLLQWLWRRATQSLFSPALTQIRMLLEEIQRKVLSWDWNWFHVCGDSKDAWQVLSLDLFLLQMSNLPLQCSCVNTPHRPIDLKGTLGQSSNGETVS